MYRRCFKSFLCLVLIIALCLSFTVPAFAAAPSWFDEFLDALPVPTVSAPDFLSSSVSELLYFEGYKSSMLKCAHLLVDVGLLDPSLNSTYLSRAYSNVYGNCFTQTFSTTSGLDYVYISLENMTKLVKQLSQYYPVELSFMPGTRCNYICLSENAIRGPDPVTAVNRLYMWDGMRAAMGGAEVIEGAALLAIPYIGNKILVAPASGEEPDFFSPEDKTNSAATTEHNYYTDSSYTDNSVTDNSVKQETTIYESGDTYNTETFDYSNGTWYDNVTGTINDIESLHYNPVTNTYTVNNTYNITYEYNYTYYYNLGSSENLVQDYKFYYELPDGRSSSDLTADEIAGLSLEFDVVNYAQDRTDENTEILVPFDGSWEDTAFNGPELIWKTGASIAYRDSAAFEGALYLDGTVSHAFGFSGFSDASSVLVNGMTVQFRYYLDGLTDSSDPLSFAFAPFTPYVSGQTQGAPYFYIFQNQLLFLQTNTMNPSKYSAGTVICSVPTGNWVDLCFSIIPIATNEVEICVYLNGLLQKRLFCNIPAGSLTKTHYPYFGFNCLNFGSNTLMTSSFDDYWSNFQPPNGAFSGQPFQMIDNLRVVDFALYDSSVPQFTPTPVPFDTNLVFVLPDTTNLKDNTIAVQSGVPVSGYRIGGVRPTFPDKGMVWMPLESDKISDCQIYNGSYWESVGCRVWTGQRWVPAWAFNVVTLSDLWDIYGGEDSDNYTEITAGSFYQWFQQHFLELKTGLIDRLDRILEALGVQVEGEEDITKPDGDGNAKFSLLQLVDRILAGVTKVPASVLSSALGSISETVGGFVTGITDFFGGVEDMGEQSEPFFESMDGVLGNASQLVHDTWNAIPEEAQDVLTTCFMLAVFGSCIVIFLG